MENSNIKMKLFFSLLLLGLLPCIRGNAQRPIIAYFSDWALESTIPYRYMTCLNFAFVRVQNDGSLDIDKKREKLSRIVANGHRNGIKVVASLSDKNGEFNNVTKDPAKQQLLVRSILAMVKEMNLDGIDIDWEYPFLKDGGDVRYLALIKALSRSLLSQGKILSIAVSAEAYKSEAIRKDVYPYVSYVEIMAYDDPNMLDGSTSSYRFTQKTLDYWLNVRGLPKSKAVLGVPIYARDKKGTAIYYSDLMKSGASPDKSSFHGINYNGKDIMLQKVNLAKMRCNGIFSWEIFGDTGDQTSMIKFIYDQMRKK